MDFQYRENTKTFFIDIDGTLIQHRDNIHEILTTYGSLVNGVIKQLMEIRKMGHYIVLTTARPEGSRYYTEKELARLGIFYDQLIMGLPIGPRILINDSRSDKQTAIGITIERDGGFDVGEYV